MPPELANARPTFEIDGTDQPALAAGLQELLITETTAGLYSLEARFGNWGDVGGVPGFRWFDGQTLDFGKQITVKIEDDTLFSGRIFALEGDFPDGEPPAIVVLAEDRLQDLRMTRRTRTFTDATVADVVRQVASDHGLQPDVSLSGPTREVLGQLNQSDLAFLRSLVLLDGGELWVDGDTLSAHPRGSRARTATLSRGESLREVRITADLAGQATSLVVGGWDRARKSRVTEEATESVVQGELGGDDAGPALLRSAFGERRQTVAHTLAETSEVARAEAEALFAAMCRSFVTARGVAETTADLRVGADVELTGVGPRFDGHYRLVEVRHRFDAEAGLRTEITAERPGLGSPA